MSSSAQLESALRSFCLLPLHRTLQTYPALHRLPSRPSRCPSDSPFGDLVGHALDHWTVSTHAFPAAYPRSLRGSALSRVNKAQAGPQLGTSERERMAEQLVTANRDCARVETADDVAQTDELQLFIAANRYHRKCSSASDLPQGITLVFSHANGLHKEVCE